MSDLSNKVERLEAQVEYYKRRECVDASTKSKAEAWDKISTLFNGEPGWNQTMAEAVYGEIVRLQNVPSTFRRTKSTVETAKAHDCLYEELASRGLENIANPLEGYIRAIVNSIA